AAYANRASAENQLPPRGVPRRSARMSASAAAPESSRTAVKLIGSMRPKPSALRQSRELAAKPIRASKGKRVVRRSRDIAGDASSLQARAARQMRSKSAQDASIARDAPGGIAGAD